MINTVFEVKSVEYPNHLRIAVMRNIGEFNSTSSFIAEFDSPFGRHSDDFSLNDEVIIKADKNTDPATTKIFTGVIEDIRFRGSGVREKLILSGRDLGAVLQDIIVQPRIFKDQEVSTIVTDIMSQNVSSSLITVTNVNVTTTIVEKITFNNISVFDALKNLAAASGFIFFVDENKDLHFEEKSSTSTGVTLNETNSPEGNFTTRDRDVFNRVQVFGARGLTGVRQTFTKGTDNTGSKYILTDQPHDMVVTTSGPQNVVLSPGGILNINDPATEDIKYLVDFIGKSVILTSGTAAGNNIQATGSVVIMDYQRSTPLIGFKEDIISQAAHGLKDKKITNLNIRSQEEATTTALDFLNEHKNPRTQGTLTVKGLVGSLNVSQTVVVNLPNFGQSGVTYDILQTSYDFNPKSVQSERVITVDLNRKNSDFIDTMKENILRLRALEASQQDAQITTFKSSLGSIGVSGVAVAVTRDIGSAFYFHTVGPLGRHDQFNSPIALLGDMRKAGSTVLTLT